MRKKIDVMLCICLLISVLSGCGAQMSAVKENKNLAEKDKASAMENDGEEEANDTDVWGNDQIPVAADGTDEAVRSLLVTETYYDGEGAVTSQGQIKYEYDSAGNQIRVLLGHEDRTYYEFIYDNAGNLVEQLSYEDGVIISHEKYEYDEDGRRINTLACFGDERSKMVSVY